MNTVLFEFLVDFRVPWERFWELFGHLFGHGCESENKVALGGHLGIHFEKNSDRFETERTAIANLYGNVWERSETAGPQVRPDVKVYLNDKAYD